MVCAAFFCRAVCFMYIYFECVNALSTFGRSAFRDYCSAIFFALAAAWPAATKIGSHTGLNGGA